MLKLSERHQTSKARLLRLLDETAESGWCQHTLYLKPDSLQVQRVKQVALGLKLSDGDMRAILDEVGPSDTGLALILGEGQATAIAPPFPIGEDGYSSGLDAAPLVELLNRDYLIGVILLRLGRYAVGIVEGEYLRASKTGSRYVKNRHRAGGQSQRRFERSRERLVRELYDKTCEIAREVFSPYERSIDYVLLGGERNTLRGFIERCRYISDFGPKILSRTLQVDRPGRDELIDIPFEVWRSRVLTFTKSDE